MASAQTPQYQARYWFDQDLAGGVTVNLAESAVNLQIVTTQLEPGLHNLHLMTTTDTKTYLQTFLFYRIADSLESQAVRYHYWFDDDFANMQSDTVATAGVLLDASSLSVGIHTVSIIAEDVTGRIYLPKTALFYRTPVFAAGNVDYVCWFDDDFAHRTTGVASGNVLIDADALPSGFHTVHLRIGNDEASTMQSQIFYKPETPAIVKYEYWINEQPDSLHTVVTVNIPDTLTVASLLTLPHPSIRSTYFHFEPDTASSRPYVNAKNDFHFRTYNAKDRYSDRMRTYVDITVVDSVYADTMDRGSTRTVNAPYNDTIRWFTVTAGVGDSLSFTASKRCTMQLFSPSGKEVMNVSGKTSLGSCGVHAYEAGYYYLAVHDAEEDSGTIDITYNWVYRYAIVSWDVHRVGNGGISSITFLGNGFNSLDTMFLIRGNDTVPTIYINRETNTKLVVAFHFEGADTGVYRGTFRFVDEDIFKNNVVTVEEPRIAVLERRLSTPGAFLRGTPAIFTYQITNTGNMTAYCVPLLIKIENPTRNGISKIKMDGLDLPSIQSGWDLSELPETEMEELEEWVNSLDDQHRFFMSAIVDTATGDTTWGRANYFIITMAPYETKTISLYITSVDPVRVHFYLPDTVSPLRTDIPPMMLADGLLGKGFVKSFKDSYCCQASKISCALTIASNLADWVAMILAAAGLATAETGVGAAAGGGGALAASITSCVLGLLSDFQSTMETVLCEDNPDVSDFFSKASLFVLAKSVLGDIAGCFLSKIKKVANVANITSKVIAGANPFDLISCTSALEGNEHQPECNPDDDTTAYPFFSRDPNDIIGYTAESGSHAVRDEQEEMPYIIEFENDTTFATAAAHTVVVVDTLDGNVFDLGSFSATAFSIGDKMYTVDGGQEFVQTVDMRPAIQALAEVRLQYNRNEGIARWTFRSLHPITLVAADTVPGFLPINTDGSGVGEVYFTINRKDNLADSAVIRNRANIVFDYEDPIATPVWKNIVDITPPESNVLGTTVTGDSVKVTMTATDNLSGIWRYHVYGMRDSVWYQLAMNVPADSSAKFKVNGQYAGFRTVAIDSAGNVEKVSLPMPTVYDTVTIARCLSIEWHDTVYTATGDYHRTLHGRRTGDADTVVTLHLTVYNPIHTAETDTVCDSYTWNETEYTQSGDYTYSHLDVNGCTQVDTLHLIVFRSFQYSVAASAWHAVASPVCSTADTEAVAWVDNLTSGTYDLYRYNEAAGKWENYRHSSFGLERGRGYIYRRTDATTLVYRGMPGSGAIGGHGLTYGCSDVALKGFNLVGNPYPHAIRKGQAFATTTDTLAIGWYELRGDGTWYAHTDADQIEMGQAVLVKAVQAVGTLDFKDITPAGSKGGQNNRNTLTFTVTDGTYSDVAHAILAEGSSLPKVNHLEAEAPMLSIPVDGSRYAIASLGDGCRYFDMDLAAPAGDYSMTLAGSRSGMGIGYLHLIDRATDSDIDLLEESTYSFSHPANQSTAHRFLVKLSPSVSPQDSRFAFQVGDNIVVEGEGTLLVFDVMGRQLFSREVSAFNPQFPVSLFPATGVYVLRLGGQSQKMVVR